MQMLCLERSDIETSLKERVRALESEVQNGQLQRSTMETRIREALAEAEQAQVRFCIFGLPVKITIEIYIRKSCVYTITMFIYTDSLGLFP